MTRWRESSLGRTGPGPRARNPRAKSRQMRDLLLRRAGRAGRRGVMSGPALASCRAPWQVVTAGHGTAVGRPSRVGTSTARSGSAARPGARSMRWAWSSRARGRTGANDGAPARTATRNPARCTAALRSCQPDPIDVVSPETSRTRRAGTVSHVAFANLFGMVAWGRGRGAPRSAPSGFGDGVWETRPLRLKRARRPDVMPLDPRLIRLISAPGGTVSPDGLAKPDGTPFAQPRPLPRATVPKCFAGALRETGARAAVPAAGLLGTRGTLRRREVRRGSSWHALRLPSPSPFLRTSRA